jgi:hypothetical protein
MRVVEVRGGRAHGGAGGAGGEHERHRQHDLKDARVRRCLLGRGRGSERREREPRTRQHPRANIDIVRQWPGDARTRQQHIQVGI